MTPPPTDSETYRWALSEAEVRSRDRLASSDQRVHWTTTHNILSKHHGRPDNKTVCAGCPEPSPWPCKVVDGAVSDLRAGPAGW